MSDPRTVTFDLDAEPRHISEALNLVTGHLSARILARHIENIRTIALARTATAWTAYRHNGRKHQATTDQALVDAVDLALTAGTGWKQISEVCDGKPHQNLIEIVANARRRLENTEEAA